MGIGPLTVDERALGLFNARLLNKLDEAIAKRETEDLVKFGDMVEIRWNVERDGLRKTAKSLRVDA